MVKLEKSCAIMQPTYLPWAGYFNLMSAVEHFVFLDDVQYERRSWQMRNKVALNGAEHLLTIPIRKCSQKTLLLDVETKLDSDWLPKHWRILSASYTKAPCGFDLLELLKPLYEPRDEPRYLAQFTVEIIRVIATYLKITCDFHFSSQLSSVGVRSQKLASLCTGLGCVNYLSPFGSKAYLEEDFFVEKYQPKLSFQKFTPRIYSQHKCEQFISHLSIIDVVANLGKVGARDYIRECL